MHASAMPAMQGQGDGYLFSRGQAWFAFAMTIGLMMFDYIDRQVIVALFPYLKAEWGLSDKQLGGLVSAVSVTVALGAIPVALLADRSSRVRSVVVMALVWSLASISCMFSRNYGQLLAARAMVGLGEAGYGSVGAALIASHFPARLRGAMLAGFFACASVGSVLGVLLGGLIAARWGWQAAFGMVGVPGLLLALLYLKVRDYPTVQLTPRLDEATRSPAKAASAIVQALMRSRSMLWLCLAGSAQLVVVSAVWAWLPSFLNRAHGMAPEQASMRAALVVLCGALGSVLWGALADRAGRRQPRAKLLVTLALCLASMGVLMLAFGAPALGLALSYGTQFALLALGGFLMTCTVGPMSAAVIDVVHPGVRATGSSVLSLFQNLLGLAAGPFIAGLLSDAWTLQHALTAMPLFSLLAAAMLLMACRSFEADLKQASLASAQDAFPTPQAPRQALA